MSGAGKCAHPLDRPVWNALNSGWSHLRRGDGSAIRLDPDYGPFAAIADLSLGNQAALARLAPDNGELWLVEADPALALPEGMTPLRQADLTQMIATEIKGEGANEGPDMDVVTLDEHHAPAMQALAALTKPGPFERHTNRLAEFIGIIDQGQLVAMCGERMRLQGFAELSGVCTHPDYRGRGYAATLMRIVARRILARGETVFLHAYASNEGAIALYESLGFVKRATMTMGVFAGYKTRP